MTGTPPETPETPEEPTTPGAADTSDSSKTGPAPQRAPGRPGAAAASRARRIGGRPTPATPARSEAAARPHPRPSRPEQAATAASPTDDPPAGTSTRAATPAEPSGWISPAPAPARGAPLPGVPGWLNWAPAGVLTAGCVVMAVLLVIFSHGVWWGSDRAAPPSAGKVNQAREQVLAAAKSCMVAANDYDYRTLGAYEKRALACTTGKLTSTLQRTIESLIMKNAPTLKAKQATQINRGGIEAVTPDGKQWTLLLFGQLSVVNAKYPNGRTDPFGAEVRMEQAGGKWVMSDLSVVSSPLQGS